MINGSEGQSGKLIATHADAIVGIRGSAPVSLFSAPVFEHPFA
jgi:hypothetical protein